MLGNGAIIVDEYMRTSNPDIFAAGDSCAVYYNPARTHAYIPLATNAVRMGTLVAENMMHPRVRYQGTQGTSGLRLYDWNIASSGLTEEAAALFGLEVESVVIEDAYRPEFMPTAEKVEFKLVYEKGTHRIVGGQVLSKADLTQAVNTLSLAIQNEMTIEELAYVDFFFQPHYNKPWHFLNSGALEAMKDKVNA
jgi:NADPH-dependent 2,4-dienoyl-CoA reductase/sulfur reductase-like enzyme